MYCRVGRACDVSECARVQRALGVCVLWCMWSHTSFLARGEIARPSPLAERSSCYTPLLCTLPAHRDSARQTPGEG